MCGPNERKDVNLYNFIELYEHEYVDIFNCMVLYKRDDYIKLFNCIIFNEREYVYLFKYTEPYNREDVHFYMCKISRMQRGLTFQLYKYFTF